MRFPVASVAAVLAVLLIELALHLVEPRLPEPVVWGGGETSVKVAQVQRMGSPGGKKRLDVLVAGPSHASLGISPGAMKLVEGVRDWEIYNGGLNGRTYTVVDFVSEHVYESCFDPEIVLLTTNPLIVNANNTRMERNSREFFAAPMPKALNSRFLEKTWRSFLVDHVYLFKYRQREPGLSEGRSNGKLIVDEYGYHPADGTFDSKDRDYIASGDHPYSEIMSRYIFGGPSADGFRSLIDRLNQKSCTVVVVNMPFRPEFLGFFEKGEAQYREFLGQMKDLSGELGFVWLDYEQKMSFDDSEFVDVDHLNREGAKRLSMQLARDLLRIRSSLTVR